MASLTLEQAYYIGELIAAFVVIISVVFLALQVQQNTTTLRLNNEHALSIIILPIMDMITNSAEVADIYQRGCADFDSLDGVEQVRFRTLVAHIHRVLSETYIQMKEGAIREERWNSFSSIYMELMQTLGMQTVWSLRKHWYSEGVRDFIDELIERGKVEAEDR